MTLTVQELLVWQRTEAVFKDTGFYLDAPEGTFFHRGYRIALAYFVAAALLFLIHWMRERGKGFEDIIADPHAPPETTGSRSPPVPTPVPSPVPAPPAEAAQQPEATEGDGTEP
jgi:hypothetical protein